MRITKVLFALFWALLLLAGCSTTNHAPLPTMVYEDLTSHYNAYFNLNEKMKAAYLAMDKAHKDNYKDVIALYTYSDPKEAKSVTADMDDVIKRSTLSVQIHKMSNWADDHFLMMGKANYIKGNYDKAQAFFKYTTTEYKNGVDYVKEMKKLGKVAKPTLKKKPVKKPRFENVLDEKGNLTLKKIDERPSYKLTVHDPARSEALVWLAKTYSAQAQYSDASAVIQFMRSDDKFYKDLDKYVEATDAENLLRQKNYRDAIHPLEKFLTMTKKKSERIRPVFILAQIYEKNGDLGKASSYYKEVLNNNPSAEMEFYAKIRRANLGKKSGSSDEIKKLLAQMSHDGKYKDYLDQIYYELGEIVLGENNRAEARKDFRKSVAVSTKNADQKALSYLQLAKMDYEEEYYVTAKFLYDSTVSNMSKTDTGYDGVQKRDKTLDKLVTQIKIIYTEDSLQRIANMSDADRTRFISRLMEAKQRELEEKQSGKGATNNDFMKNMASPGSNNSSPTEEPTFYFYNTLARSNGYNAFIKQWGNRKLEDNWRRKDKSAATVAEVAEVDSAGMAKDSTHTAAPGSEEEKLLAGLPLTPEKMEKSNTKLIDAYYALGTVYKDDLQSYHKSINTLEEMNKRFPKNKLELESWYQLYLLYDRTKNSNKSDYYKGLIMEGYPNSTIAKYLKDPNYLVELKKKENSLATYYESAYNDYTSELYASAEKKCLEVDAQFKENKMRAKFDLLNAMILAKENRLGDYVQSLNKIISKYPGTPEKDQAQDLLKNLNHSKMRQVDISKLPRDSAGNLMAGAVPDAPAYTPVVNDTTGQADFLRKVQKGGKPAAPKGGAAPSDTSKVLASGGALADNTPAYKPLTRTQRIDSIMKAAKAPPKSSGTGSPAGSTPSGAAPTDAGTPSPSGGTPSGASPTGGSPTGGTPTVGTPAGTAPDAQPAPRDTSAKAYKPLTRTQRMDSLMNAAKNPKKSNSTVIGTKPAAKGAADTSKVAAKDTAGGAVKSLNRAERLDSLMKAAKNPKNTGTVINKTGTKAPADTAKAKPTTGQKTQTPDTSAKKTVTPAKPGAVVKTTVPDSASKKTATPPKPAPVAAARPAFDMDTLTEIYGKSDDAPHYVIIYFMDPAAFTNLMVAKLDSFNSSSYADAKLTDRTMVLDKDNILIPVKSFRNKDAAQAYAAALRAKLGEMMAGVKADQYFLGAISTLNYSTLITSKKINNYKRFYRANYRTLD